MKTIILIPSLNPDDILIEFIDKLINYKFDDIIIVNDGSGGEYLYIFNEIGKKERCTVLTHKKNMGKGAALKTGIAYVLQNIPEASGIITADADGQHSPEDIAKISGNLKQNPDSLVLGVRNFNETSAPLKSRFGNKMTAVVFRVITGKKCADTQTGLRGIPIRQARTLLDVMGERFEYEMNALFTLAEKGINFIEIPIQTIYINNNRESHFRPIKDSALIYGNILKFCLSSVLSFVVDIILFTVFRKTIFVNFKNVLIYSNVSARIISGILNYAVNKKAVFGNKEKSIASFIKYAALFLTQMTVSSLSVGCLKYIGHINVTFGKIVIDTILFLFSYVIQRRFVFRNNSGKDGI